jgi:hypothetical protein
MGQTFEAVSRGGCLMWREKEEDRVGGWAGVWVERAWGAGEGWKRDSKLFLDGISRQGLSQRTNGPSEFSL